MLGPQSTQHCTTPPAAFDGQTFDDLLLPIEYPVWRPVWRRSSIENARLAPFLSFLADQIARLATCWVVRLAIFSVARLVGLFYARNHLQHTSTHEVCIPLHHLSTGGPRRWIISHIGTGLSWQ